MKRGILIISLFLVGLLVISGCKEDVWCQLFGIGENCPVGCMDVTACNYDPDALEECHDWHIEQSPVSIDEVGQITSYGNDTCPCEYPEGGYDCEGNFVMPIIDLDGPSMTGGYIVAGGADWYSIVIEEEANIKFETCAGTLEDTILSVYDEFLYNSECLGDFSNGWNCIGASSCLGFNDDGGSCGLDSSNWATSNRASKMILTLSPGTYYVKVNDYSCSEGSGGEYSVSAKTYYTQEELGCSTVDAECQAGIGCYYGGTLSCGTDWDLDSDECAGWCQDICFAAGAGSNNCAGDNFEICTEGDDVYHPGWNWAEWQCWSTGISQCASSDLMQCGCKCWADYTISYDYEYWVDPAGSQSGCDERSSGYCHGFGGSQKTVNYFEGQPTIGQFNLEECITTAEQNNVLNPGEICSSFQNGENSPYEVSSKKNYRNIFRELFRLS